MTHVVTDSCIHCKYTDCVEVCPVDCFREGPDFLIIDPDECIDCAVCIAECPVDAIFAESELPAHMVQFLDINKKLADSWPVIRKHKGALPGADGWREAKDKLAGLEMQTTTSSNP